MPESAHPNSPNSPNLEREDERFTKLSALLRLKRYEAPPPRYFEEFLHEFHRRQRAELLRRPAWKIALEQAFQWLRGLFAPGFSPFSQYAYAGASAAVLLVAVGMIFQIVQHPGPGLAQNAVGTPVSFTLNTEPKAVDSDFPQTLPNLQSAATSQPMRYVLDTRPVSYEPPSRF